MRLRLLPVLALLAMLPGFTGCGSFGGKASHEASRWLPDAAKGSGEAPTKVQQPKTEANQTQARPAKVALLVPLTGAHAQLGKSFLDAAQMAVGDIAPPNFELTPKDSGDTPDSAAAAARAAIAEGAEMIIGPVFSDSVSAVKNVAGASNIPVLGLSNDWNVAGSGTYILGFNPQQQITRVVNFALSRGKTRVAALVPNGIYGDLALETLKHTSANVGDTQRYQASAASMKTAVSALAAGRANFDAVLLPEGGAVLSSLSPALVEADLTAKNTTILGTGLWDDQNIAMVKPLLGGWFAAPEPGARQRFNARFFTTYKYKPVRLATLAYDATALAAVLARQGLSYDAGSLTNPNGFSGIDGIFRLTPDGVTERGLAVLEVGSSGSSVIDPAPRRF